LTRWSTIATTTRKEMIGTLREEGEGKKEKEKGEGEGKKEGGEKKGRKGERNK